MAEKLERKNENRKKERREKQAKETTIKKEGDRKMKEGNKRPIRK